MIYEISLVYTTEYGDMPVVALPDVDEFLRVFLEADFCGKLSWLDNRKASQYVRYTESALVRGDKDPAFEFMRQFRNASVAHPNAFLRVVGFKSMKEDQAFYVYQTKKKGENDES